MASVLLLGANSDMAVAIARGFAKRKYNILLASRNIDNLETLKNDLEIRYKVNARALKFDAADFGSHRNFYTGLNETPDVTICAFGYLGEQAEAAVNDKETENIIVANYTGAVSILNIIAEGYRKKKAGTIVGISSVAGERGRQSNYIYGSAKAGFTAYLSGLRNDLYHYGAHVVTVLPGFVNTKMTAGLKLPPMLTASVSDVAKAVVDAVEKKKDVIYVKSFWRWIMMIIKLIPETMFKKRKM